jgi:hypothetical protein
MQSSADHDDEKGPVVAPTASGLIANCSPTFVLNGSKCLDETPDLPLRDPFTPWGL